MHHQPSNLDPHFEAQTGQTAPFSSLAEEEVMAQMKQGPSLRQWRNFVGIVALVVLVACLLVFFAAFAVHAFILLAKFGWEALS